MKNIFKTINCYVQIKHIFAEKTRPLIAIQKKSIIFAVSNH